MLSTLEALQGSLARVLATNTLRIFFFARLVPQHVLAGVGGRGGRAIRASPPRRRLLGAVSATN